MIWINSHLPILQIVLSLFGALLSTASFSKKIAHLIAIFTVSCCLMISIYVFQNTNEIRYALGGWQAPVGIEYKLDFVNSPLFVLINGPMLFLLIFCKDLIEDTVLQFIAEDRQHLFFSCLLFAHTGFLGMISTNDLFNFYVFIEISSLSAYVLMAQGGNKDRVRGAFDYLIIGSIGATLILIGIGFLLSLTGSLNITDIKERLAGAPDSKILVTASCFIIIGIFLKMAFFPLHFWMVRAYKSASSAILVYLASISSVIGTYCYLRFTYFVLDYDTAWSSLGNLFKPLALIAIVACVYFALKASRLKDIIIYSAASQTGYIVFLLSLGNCNSLIFQFIIADLISKISLFLVCAKYEHTRVRPTHLENGFIVITLICSASLPLSGMFIAKINILDLLLAKDFLMESIVIITGSAFGLLYHYKMAKILFSNEGREGLKNFNFNADNIGIICLLLLQIYIVGSQKWINKYHVWEPGLFNNMSKTTLK